MQNNIDAVVCQYHLLTAFFGPKGRWRLAC